MYEYFELLNKYIFKNYFILFPDCKVNFYQEGNIKSAYLKVMLLNCNTIPHKQHYEVVKIENLTFKKKN